MTAEQEGTAHRHGRRIKFLIEGIAGHDFVLIRVLDDDPFAISSDQIEAAVCGDGRGVHAAQ